MKRKFLFIIYISLLQVIAGCNETPTEKVQQGVLDFDKTLKIGDALNRYKYFRMKNWKEEKDSQGRSIVLFDGSLEVNTDIPINKALYEAKSIGLRDGMAFVDLVYYYKNFPLSINQQMDINKKEAEKIAKRAEGRRNLTAKLVMKFGLSLKDDEVVILDKQILLTDTDGNVVDVMCSQEKTSNKILDDVYKNKNPDDDIADCIFKSKIIPIDTLQEYPKDIQYLKSIRNPAK